MAAYRMSGVYRAWKDKDISTFSNVKSSQVEDGFNCPAWSIETRPGLFGISDLRKTKSRIDTTTTYLKCPQVGVDVQQSMFHPVMVCYSLSTWIHADHNSQLISKKEIWVEVEVSPTMELMPSVPLICQPCVL